MSDDWGSLVLRGWKEVNDAMVASNLTKSREHLDHSVSLFEAALDAAEEESQFEAFIGLAHAYCDLADIDIDAAASCDHAETAVTFAECLVELWGEQNPAGMVNEELIRVKDALGCALRQRYIYLGNEDDCVRAIKLHRTCVEYDLSSKDLKATWNYHLSLALISLIRRSWTTNRLAEMIEAYNSGYAALRLSSWSNPLYLVTLCSFRVFMILETKHHSIDWVKRDSSSGHASTSSPPDIAAFLHSIGGIIGQQWLTMANSLNPSPYVEPMIRLVALTVHLLDVNKDDFNDFERHTRDAQTLLFEQGTELDLRHSPYLLDLLGALVRCKRLGLNHGDVIETLSRHLDLKLPGRVDRNDEPTKIHLDLARHHYERPRLHYLIGESIYISVSAQKMDAHRDPNYLPAIIHQRAALELTPDGHPRQLQYLLSLAFALAGSAQSTGVINDADLHEFYDWMRLIVSLQDEEDSIARDLSRGDEFEKIIPLLFSLALDEQDKVVEWGLRYIYYRHTLGSVGAEQHIVAGVAFASLSVRWALTIQKRANKCTDTSRSHIDQALLVWSELHDDYPRDPSITFGYGAALSIMANHLISLDNKKGEARRMLSTGIAHMQESLGTDPPSTFLEIENRQLLARTHIIRHRLNLDLKIAIEDDLDQAIELAQLSVAASILRNMPATIIHSVAEEWSKWAVEFHHDSVQEAYEAQIGAFIQLAWVGFDFSNRLKALKAAGQTLAADATTHALREGDLELATERLEACRIVLFSSAVSTWNTPLSLQESHPELVKKLGRLGPQIREMSHSYSEIGTTDPGRLTTSNDHMNDLAHKLRALGIEWDGIVTEVRLVEGYENFLQVTPFDTLARSNQDRLIASVVTSEQYDCCHVLFLIQGSPYVLELSLSPQKIKEIYDQFKMALRFKFGDGRDEESRIMQRFKQQQVNPDSLMGEVLKDLWDHLMQPIIEFIKQKIDHQGDALLRISVNATGQLSSLPLHAAGVYDEAGQPTDRQSVLDHAICSFAPSLASLIPKPEAPTSVAKVLALGAGHNLKHVKEEVEQVAEIFHGKGATVVQLVGTDFTMDTVKERLQDSHTVHFASHGIQDLTDPLKSRLLFHENSRLTLEESMKLYLPKAKLAVLFACETAQGDEILTNEALHLAGAMLSIGFTGAVGTLWPMADADGIPACQVFYRTLLEGEGQEIDYSRAGFALHKAVCALRDDGVGLLRWATFVHFGR